MRNSYGMRFLLLISVVFTLTSCMSFGGNETSSSRVSSPVPKTIRETIVENSPPVISKPDTDKLDTKTKSQIELLCQDSYFKGPQPYWECLGKELDKIKGLSKPDMSEVDTKLSTQIELVCQDPYFSGTIPYWDCQRKELKKVGITPTEKPVEITLNPPSGVEQKEYTSVPNLTSKPDMSNLHEVTQLIIEENCKNLKIFGVQRYWGCIKDQIEESKNIPFPDLKSVDQETREVILTSCQYRIMFGIESFYGCMNDELKSIGK